MSAELQQNEVLLEIRELNKTFDLGKGRTLQACKDVSFSLYKGETVAVVGESGSGKSTLMKMVMRMYKPTSGSVILNGQDLIELTGEAERMSRRHIQMVFQDPATAFNPRMKVKNIICEPLYNYGEISSKEADEKAREMLELVDLPGSFADRYPHEMSGGQRQRVAIARALVLDPAVIICDEATSALDMSVQDTIAKLLVRIQRERGVSYLFVCHDIALAQSMSHRIVVMQFGETVEILESTKLTEAQHPYTKQLIEAVYVLEGAIA